MGLKLASGAAGEVPGAVPGTGRTAGLRTARGNVPGGDATGGDGLPSATSGAGTICGGGAAVPQPSTPWFWVLAQPPKTNASNKAQAQAITRTGGMGCAGERLVAREVASAVIETLVAGMTRIPPKPVWESSWECNGNWRGGNKRMSAQIIGMHDWFQTPPGRYLLDWEQRQFDQAVADMFGYHALQLGLPELVGLATNRMPHRWLAQDSPQDVEAVKNLVAFKTPAGPLQTVLVSDFAALPFAANSLDLVLLPHALELGTDPHACLREVERVLVPEGRVLISGLNPASLWGLRQRRAQLYRRLLGKAELFLPQSGEFIGFWRLRDWLHLLSFEVETSRFGCYRPAVRAERWLERFGWMDRLGERWWPILGAVYFVVAVKKVRGMRLMSPAWKPVASRGRAPVSVTNRLHPQRPVQRDDLP